VATKLTKYKAIEKLEDLVTQVVQENMSESPLRDKVLASFKKIIVGEDQKIADFLRLLSTVSDEIEQDTEGDGVSLLTMHQAKGLTFDVCFIVGLEDEFIPGKNADTNIDDERRLLYVSMTRARHKLFMTYCNKRVDSQRHTGRNSGTEARQLTRFLKDIPTLTPQAITG
jgi:superfamily I DNA/RNA helicase